MARFTQAQMLDELRTIFLFEADHVLISSGSAKAEAFIGFRTEDEYCHEPTAKVDLSLFASITGSFERGYEYAFNPSLLNTFQEHEIQDLHTFLQGTPRIGGAASSETHRFMTPDGYCQMVADAALARWKLEWIADGTQTFTTRELALLANMTEGAVRMAISDKSDARLKTIQGSKPVSVSFAETKRWLAGRRGFVPCPSVPKEDQFLSLAMREAETSVDFSRLLQRISNFEPAEHLAKKARMQVEEAERWLNGNFTFDLPQARAVAECLNVDVPLFVGKALEVSLRRQGGAE